MRDSILKVPVWRRKNEFRKSCENKEQYFTENDCLIKIKIITGKTHEIGLKPYKCQFCGWWHYGHEIGIEKKMKETTE